MKEGDTDPAKPVARSGQMQTFPSGAQHTKVIASKAIPFSQIKWPMVHTKPKSASSNGIELRSRIAASMAA
jgi:hypothetical protein